MSRILEQIRRTMTACSRKGRYLAKVQALIYRCSSTSSFEAKPDSVLDEGGPRSDHERYGSLDPAKSLPQIFSESLKKQLCSKFRLIEYGLSHASFG